MEEQILQLNNRIEHLESLINQLIQPDRYLFRRTLELMAGVKIKRAGSTFSLITQTATGATSGMTLAGGSAVTEANAFKGTTGTAAYTIHGIVEALKQIGILAT